MKKIVLMLALLLANSAWAGTYSEFKSLGFSANGKFYGFLQYGIADGSGNAFATVTVVEVAKNKLVRLASEEIESEVTLKDDAAVAQALAKAKLKDFGLATGKVEGETLLARLKTDHSQASNTVFSTQTLWAEGGASATIPKYELKIQTQKLSASQCYDMVEPELMKLTLSGLHGTLVGTKVLQMDQKLPKARQCAFAYKVSRVLRHGKSLVVILDFQSLGFEGPNVEHMAVTASVDLK